jgi:RHS repeat-associated protein
MTDEAGSVVWRATYDPFGDATVDEDPDGDGTMVTLNVRFPGQYYDNETGLHYNYFRYYDPSTGRYLTADPIGQNGGLNSYSYTENNPVNYTDRYGLETNICLRPLGGTPQGPTFPVVNHTYGCVGDPISGWTCDSTIPSSGGALENTWPFGPGSSGKPSNPSNDYYDPKSCHKVVDDNECIEKCILKKWGQGRPWYQVGPGGTDCQEYTYDVILSCESSCRSAP